jgi:hypothetical protein
MTPALRVRGGVAQEAKSWRWRCVVFLWHDRAGRGEPDERYQWPESYATEAEALAAYQAHVRPALVKMQQAVIESGGSLDVHRWGLEPREEPR